MRGEDEQTGALFTYLSPEALVPAEPPLRLIRPVVNAALERLSAEFAKLYSPYGRASIPPEQLLRALLLQAFYGVRSERQLMEQVGYNMLGPPPGPGRNAEQDFHGQKRSNDTHAS